MPYQMPLGQKVFSELNISGPDQAAELARLSGSPVVFDRVSAVASEDPIPSFLHSSLCAMSLPVRRPSDDKQPIIRADRQYTLVITPKAVVQNIDGQRDLKILGVPYGSLPRVILIHIMTEAVRTHSRRVYLGKNFTDWMKRMGFRTVSYGPRGSATLVKDQVDRLFACEWMIRWDGVCSTGEKEYGIKEVKLTNEYGGIDRVNSSFSREIYLTEEFYEHLKNHAVPLNEHAIRQLKDSATALDLYSFLAYRLPRADPRRPATMSWAQLATHFGNDGKNIRKFRQTIRETWDKHVSAVYPQAKAEFDTSIVRLYSSPEPVPRKTLVGVIGQPPAHNKVSQNSAMTPEKKSPIGATPNDEEIALDMAPDEAIKARFFYHLERRIGAAEARGWFSAAKLTVSDEDKWVLTVSTKFQAKWISDNFQQALEAASRQAGLSRAPSIVAENSKALALNQND